MTLPELVIPVRSAVIFEINLVLVHNLYNYTILTSTCTSTCVLVHNSTQK